jgi:SAM-dependent methyltransferase
VDTLGEVPPGLNLYTNRLRANSFGGEATAYDTHRPRYPDDLVDELLSSGARLVLDVGAGTGIASQQLAERGADVLAVEPDARMAALARLKGIRVELDTFERWNPPGAALIWSCSRRPSIGSTPRSPCRRYAPCCGPVDASR